MPKAEAGERLRVLIIMPLAEQRGGSEMALSHLVAFGREVGVTWAVAFLENGPMERQFAEMGIETFVVPAGRLRQPHKMLLAVFKLSRIAREGRFDAVLSWMGKPHLYGGPAAMLAGIPAYWYQHGLPRRSNWQDILTTLMPARGMLACSECSAAGQRSLWPKRPVRVVHPGVDLSRFSDISPISNAELRAQLGLPATGRIIGIVGRLQRWKGFHHVVDAMPEILRSAPDVTCLMVGGDHALEPDYPAFLRGEIAQAGMADRVRLVGLQRNVQEWMAAMDVVIHASEDEPFGMVVIEAMALGRPVVASDVGGPQEIISDGVDGILWRFGDVGSLASGVIRYLNNPEFAAGVGERARKRASAFSIDNYASNVGRAMRDFVSTKRVPTEAWDAPTATEQAIS